MSLSTLIKEKSGHINIGYVLFLFIFLKMGDLIETDRKFNDLTESQNRSKWTNKFLTWGKVY
jgi:hypothetical protein